MLKINVTIPSIKGLDMARTTVPLMDTQIRNTKPKDKPYTLGDGQGLQLLVKINGIKLWEFLYTSPTTQKKRKTSLGSYPTVTLKMARTKRDERLKLIDNGIDIIEYYKKLKEKIKAEQEQEKNTIQKTLDYYYKTQRENNKLSDLTISKDKARVEIHFIKNLLLKDKTNIQEITFNQVKKTLMQLQEDNKLVTLNKVKGILIRVFKFAYTQNIITSTEVFGKLQMYEFKKQAQTINNPTLTKKTDIKKLYNDILVYKNSILTRYLMMFTIHTAQRQGSIIKAKWADIDLIKGLWIIPKEDMKGTANNKKEHHLPLSNITVKFLKEVYELTGDNIYVFPNNQATYTRNKYPHISNNTVTNALRVMNYTKEEQTAHGFRAMMKTVCKENQEKHNLKNEFVERVLAHKVDGTVEGAYNRANSIDDMRIIVNWWSSYLNNLIGAE